MPSRLASLSLRSALLLAVLAAVLLPAVAWLAGEWWFDPGLETRRAALLLMVTVQGVAAAALALWVLAWRLDRPLDRLRTQLQGVAGDRPMPSLAGLIGEDFAPLARDIEGVRHRQADLQAALRVSESQVHKATFYDAHSGLPNRALLAEMFGHEAAVARRAGRTLAVLQLGLDRFRTFSDAMGPAAGDELIGGMARRLLATLRDSDIISRGIGDEFLLLLVGPESWDQVARAAERLLRCVAEALELPRCGHVVSVSASIGIAMYPSDGADLDDLARAAALAQERSRSLGGGGYSFYQPDMDHALRQRLSSERELAQALENGEFELFYQPTVDAGSGDVVGCEALLRWRHPRRGLLAPAAFIDDARRGGLIALIDAWVLDTACADLARWRANGLRPGRLALNLSVQQARDPALSDTLREALERHRLSPEQLELEVTEDAFTDDPESLVRALARWRALGLALTIDDFGVGYSSLSHLKSLRPERLKIACGLVRGLPDNAEDGALAEAMLAMARALRIEAVADGVETPDQRRWLLQHGCARQQGHLHGPPMPVSRFEDWLGGMTVTDAVLEAP
jgi:diguanylate cyclase (GGDEF)-like protein